MLRVSFLHNACASPSHARTGQYSAAQSAASLLKRHSAATAGNGRDDAAQIAGAPHWRNTERVRVQASIGRYLFSLINLRLPNCINMSSGGCTRHKLLLCLYASAREPRFSGLIGSSRAVPITVIKLQRLQYSSFAHSRASLSRRLLLYD